ncbi:MAG: hypothetical protein ACLPYW_05030 [Acidimicrobiales bacterium]
MPGENFSRRVARAAAVGGGGGRSYRGQTPLTWYAVLLSICLVGTGLIAYSRYERTHPTVAAPKPVVPPTKANLWQVGLDSYICGKVHNLQASTLPSQPLSTNGHGVVSIEPGLSSIPAAYSGAHANLNAFLISADVILTDTSLSLPGHVKTTPTTTTTTTTTTAGTTTTTKSGATTTSTAGSTTTSTTSAATTTTSKGSTTSSSPSTSTTTTTLPLPKAKMYKNGQTCEGKPGVVEVEVWSSPSAKTGKIITKDAGSIRFKNGQLIVLAFVPKGTSIPKPASASKIAEFLISNPTGVASATTPTETVPTTVAGATTTTVAGATTTTVAGATTTTVAGATTTTKG